MSTEQRRARVGAVVLAAGFGTRLAPLTDHTPKPLLEVGGVPVMTHLLALLDDVDPAMSIVVAINGCHRDQWQRWAAPFGTRLVLHSNGVTNVDQRAGAVADLTAAVRVLPAVDRVLVIAGDNLLDEPLLPHLASAESSGRSVVLCRDLGDAVPAGRHGEVTIDATRRVIGFREKPDDPQSPLVATCSYVLDGADLGHTLADYLTGGDADSPGQFIAWLVQHRDVEARLLTGRYFDIGSPETLAAARAAFGD